MGHSSACASSCAVLALLGGLACSRTRRTPRREARSTRRRLAVDELRRAGQPRRRHPRPRRPPRRAGARAAGRRRRAAAAPEADEPDDAADAAEWAERDRAVNESNTLTGGTGLLHTQHAQSGAPGQFRLGFVDRVVHGRLPLHRQVPLPEPQRRRGLTTDTLSHIGGTLSLGTSLFNIGAGTFDGVRRHQRHRQQRRGEQARRCCRSSGDTDLGVKYMAPVGDVIHLGLFTELWLINGTGSVGLDGGGTSAKFGGIATADLRGDAIVVARPAALQREHRLLARQHGRRPAGHRDRARRSRSRASSASASASTGSTTSTSSSAARSFVADERVRPFIEGRILVAEQPPELRRATPNNPSHDNCLANDTVVPSTLTIGSRFFPWKRGFSLLAAFDIGLGGTHDFIEELQPIPPWTLYLGAGWAVDT